MNTNTCQSCGMPIESGKYCHFCVDSTGKLQNFENRLENMSQWILREKHAATPAEAKEKAIAYMATMPAWQNNPKLLALLK